MRELSQMDAFDLLYGLAADEGREESLFGRDKELARAAYAKSLLGRGIPLLWFELPLLGEPRFDLHVAHTRESLVPGMDAGQVPGGYNDVFSWYANEEPGGGACRRAMGAHTACIVHPACSHLRRFVHPFLRADLCEIPPAARFCARRQVLPTGRS